LEQGKKPADIDGAFVDQAAREYTGEPLRLSDERIREVLDPDRAARARTLFGGTAPSEVQRQIDNCHELLRRDGEKLSLKRQTLDQAAQKLEEAIDAIVSAV